MNDELPLEEVLKKRNQELSLLAKSQQLITSSLNLEEVLTFIVDTCAELVRVPACHIRLVNEDHELVFAAASGVYKDSLGEFRTLKIGESLSGWVVAHGKPLIVPDAVSDERNVHVHIMKKYGLKSFLGVPLKIREKVIGALGVSTDQIRQFSDEEIQLISSLASQAAITIENARLYTLAQQELAERKQAEEALRRGKERFRSIYEAIASGIVVRNTEGVVVHANEVGCKLMGLTLDQLQGRAPLDPEWHTIHEDGSPFPLETYPIMITAHTGKPVHNVVMGICSAESKKPRWILINSEPIFDPDTGLLKEAVATFIDITERKQAEEKIRRLNRLYSVLSQINETIVRVRDVEELYQQTCRIVVEEGSLRMAWIGLIDPKTLLVKPVAHWGFEEGYLSKLQISLADSGGGGLTGAAIREGKYLIRNSIEQDADRMRSSGEALKRGYRSCAVFPLRVGGHIIGNLNLYAGEPYFFDDEEIRLLDALAADLSFAMESIEQEKQRKQAEEKLHQQNEYLLALHETALGLMNRLNLNDVLETIVIRAGVLMGTQHGYIRLVEPGETEMTLKVGIGIFSNLIGHQLKFGEGLGGKVWQIGQPIAVEDYRTWPGRVLDPKYHIFHAEVAIPLKSSSKVVGVLCLGYVEEGRIFRDEEIELLSRFAQLASIALDNARLYTLAQQEIAERKQAEEALKHSEERLVRIMETMANGIIIADQKGCFTYANAAAEKIYGVSRYVITQRAYNDPMWKMTDRDGKPLDEIAVVPQILQTGEPVYGVERIIERPDGRKVVLLANLVPLRDATGAVEGVMSVFTDITDRIRVEEALRKSEAINQALLNAIPDAMTRFSRDGTYLDVRPAKDFDLILPPHELIGKNLCEIFPAELAQRALSTIEQALQTGETQILEYQLLKRGQMRDLESRVVVSGKDEVLVIVRDITERKQAQEALAAEKERLAVTLQSIGDGVITTDTKGRIVLINQVAETLTGWTEEEAVGKPLSQVFQIINKKTRESCENPVDKVLETGGLVDLANHTILVAKDGTERIIADSGAPIRDKTNQIIGVVLVFRDITEHQKLEEELLRAQKLESVGILAGGIAHDFNNILTAILINISLAKMYANPQDEIFKRLTEAEKASLRARDLTQQLLTFSKGGAPVKKIASMIELVKDSANFALRGSRARCEFCIPDDLWPVEVDEGQISQVIHNLVINAQQAMPEGGVIQIKAENRIVGMEGELGLPLEAGKYVKLSITDEGSGIPEEYLAKIFDPYFTTKEKGSGLGLATTYSILKRHDGYIGVESKVGVGTTFYIYLPASQKGISAKSVEVSPKVHPKLSKGKVLLMDDDEMLREAAGQMLQYMGYEAEFAGDGVEALGLYRRAKEYGKPFNVVIMDLTIPGGMGGKEAIQKLLEIDPQVKAIVSSGYSDDPVMAEYRRYGFRGVITKPYKIEELNQILQQLIVG